MTDELFGSPFPNGSFDAPELRELTPNKLLSLDDHLNRKRVAPTDHGERTRTILERMGFTISKVEFTGYTGSKHDLFGLFDYLAIGHDETIGVQVCTESDWRNHLRKACRDDVDKKSGRKRIDNLRLWIEAPGRRALILGWEKRPSVGNRVWFETFHYVQTRDIEETLGRRKGNAGTGK